MCKPQLIQQKDTAIEFTDTNKKRQSQQKAENEKYTCIFTLYFLRYT